jgi:hypothetical protein
MYTQPPNVYPIDSVFDFFNNLWNKAETNALLFIEKLLNFPFHVF